ncbi:phospholipid-transporting ATPase 2-like [Coffea eugenioides]|uniref:phospholipid-transporting ATPase 2-like n=1 Tax=Coffea eugenioides TaxID=49369 RepID=UPI000F612BBD|nr:phospholipid-transporting ATPase 2-like [Coffea eugenioides]
MVDVSQLNAFRLKFGFHPAVSNITNKIWVLWKSEFAVNVLINSEQFIHVTVTNVSWRSEVCCSFVYAKCSPVERRSLWADLMSILGNLVSKPWIVGGDFNVIAVEDEYLIEAEKWVGPGAFKFQHMWIKHLEFLGVVEQSWKQPLEGYGMFLFAQKLKRLKRALSEWNRNVFGNIFENIARTKEEVRQKELRLEEEDNEETRIQLSHAKANLLKCLANEEIYWKQKDRLVELLKSCEYRTLAIGDGGNDVRMIQQAHIGVGISGREGLQAARAADYSIGKFRFLKRLILVHGRYSYNRTAFLSQYSFYKSLLICFIQIFFSLISGVSGTSLFNSVSLMAYNVFYTSVPVLVNVLDKDLSERTVMQHPQILFYCQAGRLLNPSTFAGWFGRSLFHAIVVFVISIHSYAFEKSEMEELSMVVLSGCIWLQAFVVALETNSFTILQHLAIWGNLVAFYVINWIVSALPSSGMYTIMFRLCRQPSYWITMFLIVVAGMGPVLALKYFRYTYRPSKINILRQAERLGGPILSLGNIEPQSRAFEKEVSPLSISQPKSRSPVYEPLLSDSPNAIRRSFGPGAPFDFFPSQSRLSSSYARNCKDN